MVLDGPKGKVEYLGKGVFYFRKENIRKRYNKVSMIAGGTGIAPCYQLLIHLLDEKELKWDIRILCGNRTKSDILLKDELDQISKEHGVKVAHTLDRADDDWKGYIGFVSKKMISEFFSGPTNDHLVFYCGPRLMNQDVRKSLLQLGYDERHTFKF